jgi:predicted ArsR family transcriptional regulator
LARSVDIRKTVVVKYEGHPERDGEGRTRDAIVRRLLERGPSTAMDLAGELGLSGAAVRRHLDALIAEDAVSTRDAPRSSERGRGRPARQHLLTEAGRRRAGHRADSDDAVAGLAIAALRELAEQGGDEAVRAFARGRVARLLADHHADLHAAATSGAPAERVGALAAALSASGYAASARPAHVSGDQLCQHHCPVARVAAEFPQLCEVETEMFAELLGTHVQRLSTIARGDAACTTHVPAARDSASDSSATTSTSDQGRQVV